MNEELRNILSRVDHTLLGQAATWSEIKTICDDGIKYGCASVCIPASYVKQAAEYVDGRIAVCTVIGFPNGYDTTAAKCFEAADAVKNGASEIDMVINIGWVKDQRWDDLLEEIKAVKAAGGISSIDDAEKFIALGASRLGTSRIVKIVKQNEHQ